MRASWRWDILAVQFSGKEVEIRKRFFLVSWPRRADLRLFHGASQLQICQPCGWRAVGEQIGSLHKEI
jgi:hypothetical protein